MKSKLQACTRAHDKCVLVIAARRPASDQSAGRNPTETVMTEHDSGGKCRISRRSPHPPSPPPPLSPPPQWAAGLAV